MAHEPGQRPGTARRARGTATKTGLRLAREDNRNIFSRENDFYFENFASVPSAVAARLGQRHGVTYGGARVARAH